MGGGEATAGEDNAVSAVSVAAAQWLVEFASVVELPGPLFRVGVEEEGGGEVLVDLAVDQGAGLGAVLEVGGEAGGGGDPLEDGIDVGGAAPLVDGGATDELGLRGG